MRDDRPSPAPLPNEAVVAAALFCVDPVGIGGAALRHCSPNGRDAFLKLVAELMPPAGVIRVMPLSIQEDRLLGGLDLSATLVAGRPIAQAGLLVEIDGGTLVLNSADRMSQRTAAHLVAALDAREVVTQRSGAVARHPSRFGVIAFDGGIADDERPPDKLMDRLAFRLDFTTPAQDVGSAGVDRGDGDGDLDLGASRSSVAAARALLPRVQASHDMRHAVCEAAAALGVDSIRAAVLTMRVAIAHAALRASPDVCFDDAALAVRLVLLPRATMLPTSEDPADAPPAPSEQAGPPEPQADAANGKDGASPTDPGDAQPEPPAEPNPGLNADPDPGPDSKTDLDPDPASGDMVLQAALASLPHGLLDLLKLRLAAQAPSRSAGRAGAPARSGHRGRPDGVRAGLPRDGLRLNLIETLRAAAPWQTLRGRHLGGSKGTGDRDGSSDDGNVPKPAPGIRLRRADFRVTHYRQRSETTTLFAVDASGSAALQRLAEAKGAVELLLADCYVRRDSVALVAFRGRSAEVLLPVTRSLVRAKRSLAGLAGGGGTPLAAAIDLTLSLAMAARRQGRTPVVVLLTDGRGNVARDGSGGRSRALSDAHDAARQMRAAGITALVLDTSPQPHEEARQLAAEMGAVYLPLPHADAAAMSRVMRVAAEGQRSDGRSSMP